ncbi:hypothetical protein GCM10023188_25880 [Pontibacter saemangeumensis]|uniref:Uncharacterized protein n=1 Tax=Pontibacter saemangeumensis TaxID=1084525 RepID=A0ABP8LT39_9BACT
MITILERPAEFSAVGGFLPNPVRYRIGTDSAFISATIHRADATVIGTLRASARNGEAVLDVSSYLRSELKPQIPVGLQVVEKAAGASAAFWCDFATGAGESVSDSEHVRYAVAAALPAGESDYSVYVIS